MARIHAVAFLLGLAFLIGALVTSRPAAQESGNSEADPCAERSTGKEVWDSDEAMWTCRHEQLDKSEADLAAIVRELAASYDGDERIALLAAAHDAWLRFRDAECKLRTIDSASGTMFDLYWTVCLTEQNVQRTAQMRWLLDRP